MWNNLEKRVKNIEKPGKNRQKCQKTGRKPSKILKIVKNAIKR